MQISYWLYRKCSTSSEKGTQVISSQSYVIVSGFDNNDNTPKSSSSKFLIEYTIAGSIYNDTNHGYLQIYKNGSALTDAQRH